MIKKTLQYSILILVFFMILFLIGIKYIGHHYDKDRELKFIFGYSCLSVLTGSMEPIIEPGDMIIISKPDTQSFKEGTIATYQLAGGELVTHRITSVKESSGQFLYQFKGDANNTADAKWIPGESIVGTYGFRIYQLESLLHKLKGPYLVIILGVGWLLIELVKFISKQLSNLEQDEEGGCK